MNCLFNLDNGHFITGESMLYIVSFFAGVLGTIMGGTQTFVTTGIVGLIIAFLSFMNIHIPFLNDVINGVLFMPCVIFNGAAIATAYASKKYDIRGVDTNRSLLFTKDYKVFLMGGLFGLVGYSLFNLFTYLNFNLDIGGLVVFLVGCIGRALYGFKWVNNEKIAINSHALTNMFVFQTIFSVITSLITILLVDLTGITSIGFSISAASLIFTFVYPAFPATHHITMVSGYAFAQTHNIMISVLFGLCAHLIFTIFGRKCNTPECGSLIDPPALAIFSMSFIIFTFF